MKKNRATGPAWQVRDAARNGLLEKIKQKIMIREEDVGAINLHRIFLLLLDKKLALSQSGIKNNDLPEIPWSSKEQVFNLFLEVSEEIGNFQYSKEEGVFLLEKLFIWTADEIGRPHRELYGAQETAMLKALYNVERATDEVPLE